MMDKYHGDEPYCMENNLCHCFECDEEKYYLKQDVEYELWLDELVREEFND